MSLQPQLRSPSLAWTHPLAVWWIFLSVVSAANIAAWLALYHLLPAQPAAGLAGSSNVQLMLALSAAYVFGCAFRSFFPRADVQRICLFDTWLSCVTVGRSVATVAEVSFAAQWAVLLYALGAHTGADTATNAAWAILSVIVVAQCLSWYAVLTRNWLANAVENSLWAVGFLIVGVALCRLLPEFDGVVRLVLAAGVAGIVAFIAFLVLVDVPMYLSRWRGRHAGGDRRLGPLEGLRDATTRWVVTHDLAEWKDEIAWMSLYFSGAVWASLALCAFYALAVAG
jgi:hypothetical protein